MLEPVKADITRLNVDAIVNAANAALSGGGGVDRAIHRAAGPELLAACRALGRCAPGDAVVTPGFELKARLVIHAVGPVWDGGEKGEAATLERVYERAFTLARENEVRSIAFPAISAGAYRFPVALAADIALRVMLKHEPEFERVVACLFDDQMFAEYVKAERTLRAH